MQGQSNFLAVIGYIVFPILSLGSEACSHGQLEFVVDMALEARFVLALPEVPLLPIFQEGILPSHVGDEVRRVIDSPFGMKMLSSPLEGCFRCEEFGMRLGYKDERCSVMFITIVEDGQKQFFII